MRLKEAASAPISSSRSPVETRAEKSPWANFSAASAISLMGLARTFAEKKPRISAAAMMMSDIIRKMLRMLRQASTTPETLDTAKT